VSALKKEIIIKSDKELLQWFQEGIKNYAKGIKVSKYVRIYC